MRILIGYSMRSGSTLLQHILHQHPDLKSYSDFNSLFVLPRLLLGSSADQICVKPMDIFYLGKKVPLREKFDRFVWISRDPRDSYVSSLEYKWASAFWPKGPKRHGVATGLVRRWKRVYQHYFTNQDDWHLVRYEDLTHKPEAVTRSLLNYLGLPYANVIEFDRFKGLSGGDLKLRKERTVHRKSVYRFQKVLSLEQQEVFSEMIGTEMTALGYDPKPQVAPASSALESNSPGCSPSEIVSA